MVLYNMSVAGVRVVEFGTYSTVKKLLVYVVHFFSPIAIA